VSENDQETPRSAGIDPAKPVRLGDVIEYSDGSVVSRTIKKGKAGTLTIFAFDEGEGLSEHTAPFDAYVQVLDGVAELTVGGETVRATVGETVLMPADVPHAVHAAKRLKMLLIMIRE